MSKVGGAPPAQQPKSGPRAPPGKGPTAAQQQAAAQDLAAREAREQAPEIQAQEAIESLLSCYEGILSHSRSFNSAADSAGQVSLDWHVSKLTQSSESLLQIIANLKTSVVANNIPACNQRVDVRSKELKTAELQRQQALVTLGDEISHLLHELETNFYTAR
mmetsp:Transcript_31361/g.76850  ORF Transcript_31361/g.76850 Transcript_31361/m.76850 type:complete len:162 (-) Transcript_31361:232-717(-)